MPKKEKTKKTERVPTKGMTPAREASAEVEASSSPAIDSSRHPFPIVAIGSSAGGLEALEEFFCHLPPSPGAAFVVLTHQSLNQVSLLPQLLRRWTPLPVVEATDRLRVGPNTVYLPPPGTRLSLFHMVLHLMGTDGQRPVSPIDHFFSSLANDQQDNAVGIVLSGTGADGALGIKAIRAESGLTMAQEPRSAKYAAMPQHAIATGAMDIVAPAPELGKRLCDFLRRRTLIPSPPADGTMVLDADQKRDLTTILVYLRDRTGNDFSLYKDNTILRRIQRRMSIHQVETLSHYFRLVRSDAGEVDALFQELLIGVTSFFRDPASFEAVTQKGLPQLLAGKPDGYRFRLWVPACSTGEEAYTLTILLREYLEQQQRRFTLQVFGTDIDGSAIDKARYGLYPEAIADHVTQERLERFFVREDFHYRVKPEIRDCITFATHNLLKDPPFTKMDILSCRNFLIYLRPETQHRLIPLFHYALKPHGLLLLGNAETMDGFTNLFDTVDRQQRLFSRRPGSSSGFVTVTDIALENIQRADRPARPPMPAAYRPSYLVESIQTLLADRFVPPAVVVNRQGEVVYIHGRTGDYLEPAPGPANQQVVDMARPELRRDLMAALRMAEKDGEAVVRSGIKLAGSGNSQRVTVTVTPLYKPEALKGLLLIVFEPATGRSAPRPVLQRTAAGALEEAGAVMELEYTKQQLRRVNEELQLSNEEFKQANEELQSTNEELQSTNEEMVTTKEELQSLNEELLTVNAEFQSKLEQLTNTHDDLQNLVNSTEVATVFLDRNLRIRRFTPHAARISKVIASDIGRSFEDIVSTVRYEGLIDDARAVLHTLKSTEREVQALDGRWYLLRILPYRTSSNVIDGVVLTYLDTSAATRAAQATRQAQLYAEAIVDTIPEPLLVLDVDLRVVSANRALYQLLQSNPAQVERHPLDRVFGGQFNQPTFRALLESVLVRETTIEQYDVTLALAGNGPTSWRVHIRRFLPAPDQAPLLLVAFERNSNGAAPGAEK
jgi:two-component system, chemotaxis family, CheB/CheR fusion protein